MAKHRHNLVRIIHLARNTVHADHVAPCRFCRCHTISRIFENAALVRSQSHPVDCYEIGLGVGLASLNIGTANGELHRFWK